MSSSTPMLLTTTYIPVITKYSDIVVAPQPQLQINIFPVLQLYPPGYFLDMQIQHIPKANSLPSF